MPKPRRRRREAGIEVAHVEIAKEALIRRRDTHLDSLIDRLREDRIRKVIAPILTGDHPADDVFDDFIQFAKDLGLVASGPDGLGIANPIYREIVPRALTAATEEFMPVRRSAYIAEDGRLLPWPTAAELFPGAARIRHTASGDGDLLEEQEQEQE